MAPQAWYDRDEDGADLGLSSERSLLDHILVSKCVQWAITAVEVFSEHDPTAVSDHWPVKVTIDTALLASCAGNPAGLQIVAPATIIYMQHFHVLLKMFMKELFPMKINGWSASINGYRT